MNAYFWNAVLSVPDDEEAKRMMDMLELYERDQADAERQRMEKRMGRLLREMRDEAERTR